MSMSGNVALESSATVIVNEGLSSMQIKLHAHRYKRRRHMVFLSNLSRSVCSMSEKDRALNHVEGLKAQLAEWIEIMDDDEHFAPPAWVMESMFNRLLIIEYILQG